MNNLEELVERLQKVCLKKGLTIAVAESCTGGMIASAIVNLPGSSGYFKGGVISYSNAAKVDVLDVNAEKLASHGAVSGEVAVQMAAGVRRLFHSDGAVSVTGIAGPGGGTSDKPVGTTYIGLSSVGGTIAHYYLWQGDREHNRRASAEEAVRLLIDWAETYS